MAISQVETETKKRTAKISTTPAPVYSAENPPPPPVAAASEPTPSAVIDTDIDAAERQLRSMYDTPAPIVSRMTFSLSATIPTGNFENIIPKIEIEFIVPEGAVPPNEIEQLEAMRSELARFIFPLCEAQTAGINVKNLALQPDETKAKLEMAAAYTAASPLFKWLTTFERKSAGKLLSSRIATYKDMN